MQKLELESRGRAFSPKNTYIRNPSAASASVGVLDALRGEFFAKCQVPGTRNRLCARYVWQLSAARTMIGGVPHVVDTLNIAETLAKLISFTSRCVRRIPAGALSLKLQSSGLT